MKNTKYTKYTFLWTSNYDDSKPNNNYSDASDTMIFEEDYTIENYLLDNDCPFEKNICEGEYILLDQFTGEPTGERILVIKVELIDKDGNEQ